MVARRRRARKGRRGAVSDLDPLSGPSASRRPRVTVGPGPTAAPSWESRPRPGGPRGPRAPGGTPEIDPQAALKGMVVVIITLVVGAAVFWQGLHKPADLATGPLAAGGASTVPLLPSIVPSTAPTPATRLAPKDLQVVVGNAVDPRKPVAGTVADKLKAAGYATVRRLDATKAAPRSAVHFAAPEWRDDAVAVATALGIPETDVTPLPNPSPVVIPDGKTYQVYVIAGREPKALTDPPTTAPTR
jgi:hypothetical protein